MPTRLTMVMHPVGKVFMGVGVLVILEGKVLLMVSMCGENIKTMILDKDKWNQYA